VIGRLNEWRASLPNEGEDVSPESIIAFERLLYAIRADLGNPRGDMEVGDLLRAFIDDLAEYMTARIRDEVTAGLDLSAGQVQLSVGSADRLDGSRPLGERKHVGPRVEGLRLTCRVV
jgi:hypothetical protein